jgi:hypothetical protein
LNGVFPRDYLDRPPVALPKKSRVKTPFHATSGETVSDITLQEGILLLGERKPLLPPRSGTFLKDTIGAFPPACSFSEMSAERDLPGQKLGRVTGGPSSQLKAQWNAKPTLRCERLKTHRNHQRTGVPDRHPAQFLAWQIPFGLHPRPKKKPQPRRATAD